MLWVTFNLTSAIAFNLLLNFVFWERFNPLPDMPILGSPNSAVNTDIVLKI